MGLKIAVTLAILPALLATVEPVLANEPDRPGAITALAYVDPPFMDTDGIHQRGIAIDIARELFTRAQIPYNLIFVPPKRANTFATSSPGNCVIATARSQEREAQLAWIGPFLITRHAFYRNSNSPIRVQALSDSSEYRVGTFLGSGTEEYLEGMGMTVDQAPSNDLNLKKLALGRIDLWASDTVSASLLIRETQAPVVMEKAFLTTLREMACHPATPPETLDRMRETLKSMYQDGTVRKLYGNYLGPGVKWLDIR